MPSLNNISWERIEREDAVTYPADAPDKPGNEIIFATGLSRPPTDAASIVPADLLPPDEVPDDEYPAGADHRAAARTLAYRRDDTACRRARRDRAAGHCRHEPARDRPAGSANPGEMIASRHGAARSMPMLRADREVADGMIFIPFCFNESPANRLTNPQLDPFGKIPEFKYCAARIEGMAASEAAE